MEQFVKDNHLEPTEQEMNTYFTRMKELQMQLRVKLEEDKMKLLTELKDTTLSEQQRNPVKQGIFITISAIGSLIVGLTGLYEAFFDTVGIIWYSLLPAILNLILSALLWISLKQAKDILWDKAE